MNNNYLKNELRQLQADYLNVLKSSITKLETDDFKYVVDEISIFWFINRNLVTLLLDNYSEENHDTFLFTGATYVDVQDNELFPLVALGDYHIIDDSFAGLGVLISNMPNNNEFKERTKKLVIKAAQDNIEIIEKYGDFLCVLPVTLLEREEEIELLSKGADNAFLGLFKDPAISNIGEYFNRYSTVEEAIKDIKEHAHEMIIFTEYDSGSNLLLKFKNFKSSGASPLPKDTDDIMIFYSILHSFFMRALGINLMCYKYKLVPYLRYFLNFQYFILLCDNFKDDPIISEMAFKTKCAFIMYKILDREKIKKIDLPVFFKQIKSQQFSKKCFAELKKDITDFSNITLKTIDEVLTKNLPKNFAPRKLN